MYNIDKDKEVKEVFNMKTIRPLKFITDYIRSLPPNS